MLNDSTVVADVFVKIGLLMGVRYGVWHPNHVM